MSFLRLEGIHQPRGRNIPRVRKYEEEDEKLRGETFGDKDWPGLMFGSKFRGRLGVLCL